MVFSACGDDLPRPTLIADLRVLAIRAEPPEGTAGTEVAIDALVLAPLPSTDFEMRWFACVGATAAECGNDPQAFLAADPCDGNGATQPVCDLGKASAPRFRLPTLARAGGKECKASDPKNGKPGGVAVLLAVAETDKGGIAGCFLDAMESRTAPDYCRLAFKRIRVLQSCAKDTNTNPGLTSLSHANDSQPYPLKPGDKIDLAVTLSPDAQETFPSQEIRDGVPVEIEATETLFLTWVATGGTLGHFHTDGNETGLANTFEAPTQPGVYTVAAILRDGRGGQSWRTAQYAVQAP